MNNNKQHTDNFSTIKHLANKTTSNQLFKSILDDNARGGFTGKIYIHRNTLDTDAQQLNKNLLLSQKTHINSRPQLEIYTDSTKCSHGAATGQLNQEQIFYLKTRGFSLKKSIFLLSRAFFQEVIEQIDSPNLKVYIEKLINNKFETFTLGDISK